MSSAVLTYTSPSSRSVSSISAMTVVVGIVGTTPATSVRLFINRLVEYAISVCYIILPLTEPEAQESSLRSEPSQSGLACCRGANL